MIDGFASYVLSQIDWLVFAWFMANMATGIAHMFIAYELFVWCRKQDWSGLQYPSYILCVIFLLSSAHCFSMLRHTGTQSNDPFQVFIDGMLALVSVAFCYVMTHNRDRIRQATRKLKDLFT